MGATKVVSLCAAVGLTALVASGCSSPAETKTDTAQKAATSATTKPADSSAKGTANGATTSAAQPATEGTGEAGSQNGTAAQPGQMIALKHAFKGVQGSKDFPRPSTDHNIPEAPGKPPVDSSKVAFGRLKKGWPNTTKEEYGQKHCPSLVKPEELGLKPEETTVAWGHFDSEGCTFLTKDTFVKVHYSSMRQWLRQYPYGVDPALADKVSPADKVGFQAEQRRRTKRVDENGSLCTIVLEEANKAGFGQADSPKVVAGTHETKEGKFTSKQLLTCRDHMMISIDVFAMNEDGLKAVSDANMQTVAKNLPARALPRLKEHAAAAAK